jgi:hypothetical protein
MNFRQDGVSADQVQRSIRSMIRDGNFNANAIFIDGYDFSKSTVAEFASFGRFAQDAGLEIWFSASVQKYAPVSENSGIPIFLEAYLPAIAILINLEPCGNFMHLRLIKDHEVIPMTDLHLKLDPQILLIAEET